MAERLALLQRLFPELDPAEVARVVQTNPGASFDELLGVLRQPGSRTSPDERSIPGTHYIRDPRTGEIDIYDNPPESLREFIVPPDQLPGPLESWPPPTQQPPQPRLFLGPRGLYEALEPVNPADDYQIVETRQDGEALLHAGGPLPLVVPASVLAHGPTMQELERYRSAQYETPTSPFGAWARRRSGYAGAPPEVDPKYDHSAEPMRQWPLGTAPPFNWKAFQKSLQDSLKELQDQPSPTAEPLAPVSLTPPVPQRSLADLAPVADSPVMLAGRMRPGQLRRREPLPRQPDRPGQGSPTPTGERTPPMRLMPGWRPMSPDDVDQLYEGWEREHPLRAEMPERSLADAVRSTLPQIPTPVDPGLMPLADYLQQLALERAPARA